jgi:hypothetical protein
MTYIGHAFDQQMTYSGQGRMTYSGQAFDQQMTYSRQEA